MWFPAFVSDDWFPGPRLPSNFFHANIEVIVVCPKIDAGSNVAIQFSVRGCSVKDSFFVHMLLWICIKDRRRRSFQLQPLRFMIGLILSAWSFVREKFIVCE